MADRWLSYFVCALERSFSAAIDSHATNEAGAVIVHCDTLCPFFCRCLIHESDMPIIETTDLRADVVS
jgi:hypothetical protein